MNQIFEYRIIILKNLWVCNSPAESSEMLGFCNLLARLAESNYRNNIVSTNFGILGSSPPESGEGSLQYVQRWILSLKFEIMILG